MCFGKNDDTLISCLTFLIYSLIFCDYLFIFHSMDSRTMVTMVVCGGGVDDGGGSGGDGGSVGGSDGYGGDRQ